MLGFVPLPEIEGGEHFVAILFKLGTVGKEEPISWQSIESWERRCGIRLPPWQAELIMDLSRAYLTEMHSAKHMSAIAPWPRARNMWKYVKDQLDGGRVRKVLLEDERLAKEEKRNGNRKRR